jgi:hypothetical protein
MAREVSSPERDSGVAAGSKSPQRRRGLAGLAQNALLAAFSIFSTLALLEITLRLYHGELTNFSSQLPPVPNRAANPAASYDALLGWVPRIGLFERSPDEKWTVTDAGLRSNGSTLVSQKRSVVVVGDSFTFGDEVLDHETWPAQLEQRMQVPVLNGGVFAYGVDQAFLRAEQLLKTYHPQFVVLAFISDDISRAEFSFYSGWKPYFEYGAGELALRNVPVPQSEAVAPRYAMLRKVLSYSFLFSAVLSRAAPRWWSPSAIVRVHHDGESVAVDLFSRLQAMADSNDARLVVVALGTNGRISGNARTGNVVDQARRRGIDVLNLLPEVEQIPQDSEAVMFKPRGHYAPSMNARIAARIETHLNSLR